MAEPPLSAGGLAGSGRAGASLTGRTLAGLQWAGLSAAAQAVASLAILAALSRLLTPVDFGVLAIALVFVTAAQVLGLQNLGSAIVQRHDLGDRHVAAALTLAAAAGGLLAGAVWLLAPAIGRFFAEPAVAPALGALSLAIAISGLSTVPEYLLNRQLRFRALAAAELLSQVLGYGLVAIALAAHGFGVWALVWGAVARQGVFAAAVLAAAPRLPRPGLARREAGEVLRAGAGFSSIAFFDLAARQGSRLVVGRLLGAASLGHYTRATALAVFAGHPGQIVTRVLFPAMAQRQHRTDRLGAVYLHGSEFLALLALPASLMLAVSAPEIVAVVLGAQWDAAVPVLQVLGAGAAFRIGGLLNTPVTRAMGALRRVTWRLAVYACLLLAGIAAGSRWGLPGVAAAAVLAFAVSWADDDAARAVAARAGLARSPRAPPAGALGRRLGRAGAVADRGAGPRRRAACRRRAGGASRGLPHRGGAGRPVRAAPRAARVPRLGARAAALRHHGPAGARALLRAVAAGAPVRPMRRPDTRDAARLLARALAAPGGGACSRARSAAARSRCWRGGSCVRLSRSAVRSPRRWLPPSIQGTTRRRWPCCRRPDAGPTSGRRRSCLTGIVISGYATRRWLRAASSRRSARPTPAPG